MRQIQVTVYASVARRASWARYPMACRFQHQKADISGPISGSSYVVMQISKSSYVIFMRKILKFAYYSMTRTAAWRLVVQVTRG
jgi:hypothetical protein